MKHSIPNKFILIGASTGGPGQIQKIVQALPILKNTTVIIAQHMAIGFIGSFTDNLNKVSLNPVSIIKDQQTCMSNHLYTTDGNVNIYSDKGQFIFKQRKLLSNAFNPDINILFNSFTPLCDKFKITSVILTGIGDDGVEACKNLSAHGARCITESKESAIVDGMPSHVREFVPNVEVYDINKIIQILNKLCQ